MQKLTSGTRNIIITLAILGAFFAGSYVGANNRPEIDKVSLANKETGVATEADFSPFWKVWKDIKEKYPEAHKTTDQEKIYGAISGLVGSLNDPYSVFFFPQEAKSF